MEGELQKTVGRNLRRVRTGLGVSQERFGEAVGWHRTLVGAVERGERNLTLRSVERVSAQLGVDPLELLRDPGTDDAAEAPATGLRAAADGGGPPAAGPSSRSSKPRTR